MKHVGLAIAVTFILGFAQNATAGDLIVVDTKDTQKSSTDWLGFLETKEEWYEMLQDWFDIDDLEGFHVH